MDKRYNSKEEWAAMIRMIRIVRERLMDYEGECIIHYDTAVDYNCPVDWKNEPLVKSRLESHPRIKVKEEFNLLSSGN